MNSEDIKKGDNVRLVSTTADFADYFKDKSVSAPLAAFSGTGFKHIDLSMYDAIYDGSPWTEEGDGWKKEIDECARIAAKHGFDFFLRFGFKHRPSEIISEKFALHFVCFSSFYL